jgi:DNA-binding CsgD family transcriptional regulator
MRERLAAVLETTGELQRKRFELMRRMGDTMSQMRALRARLQTLVDDRAGDGTPAPAARLAEKFHLTPREVDVAMLLSSGAPNMVIAGVLSISEHTARHHTRHVLVKLGLHSRARAAALIARELGTAAPPFPDGRFAHSRRAGVPA